MTRYSVTKVTIEEVRSQAMLLSGIRVNGKVHCHKKLKSVHYEKSQKPSNIV